MGTCFSTCFERSSDDEVDDDDDIGLDRTYTASNTAKHAFLSFQRGINEDGTDCVEHVSKINDYLNQNGVTTLYEQDKLNIEGIGILKKDI